MVKGRIIRDARFGSVTGITDSVRRRDDDQIDGLKALAREEDRTDEEVQGWGIEVVLRLKRIVDPPSHPTPRAQSTRARSTTPMATSSTLLLSTPAGRFHGSGTGEEQTSSPLLASLQTPVDVERLKVEVFGEREIDGRKRRWNGEEVRSERLRKRMTTENEEVVAVTDFASTNKDVDMLESTPVTIDLTIPAIRNVQAEVSLGTSPPATPSSLQKQMSVEPDVIIVLDDPKQDKLSKPVTNDPSLETLPLQLPQHTEVATKKNTTTAKNEATTKSKRGRKKIPPRPGIFCSNCGRTETCTWRQKEDQRVCNGG
jgi:hypothetical protein